MFRRFWLQTFQEREPFDVFRPRIFASFSMLTLSKLSWNVQMVGALIAALPTLLVYIFLGKYFVRGLLAGSVKG